MPIALGMDTTLHDAAVPPLELRPPPLAASPPAGSMNYSPKHSRRPNSLLNSRNINMKHLLLNLSPTAPATTLPPRRGKPLALTIPASPLATQPAVSTPTALSHFARLATHTDNATLATSSAQSARPQHALPLGSVEADPHIPLSESFSSLARGLSLRSPFSSGRAADATHEAAAHDGLAARMARMDLAGDTAAGESASEPYSHSSALFNSNEFTSDESTSSLESAHHYDTSNSYLAAGKYAYAFPEELQESLMVHAYPHGPANVLNSILYLYLDPQAPDLLADINTYDLVVNVARECEDMSTYFNAHSAQKNHSKYLYVPWSHTSSILTELPRITAEIARYDRPGNKILVHCQCGVLRSACVVVAYFMVKFGISVNEAYELLKSGTSNRAEAFNSEAADAGNTVDACERICPNMSLIFELMDFGDRLTNSDL